jgi:NADH-quinone oxidoreductase subunit G
MQEKHNTMAKIFIDEESFEVEDGITVFKAAREAGIDIPHLCYHEAFPPEGSCRMCLVEIEGLPKLELACSTQVRDGMKIFTKSERVIEARKGVLEFLLAEHPLDCPICDKAGDCKLQDYYEAYGLFESQFREVKEKREKKVKIGKNLIHDEERCVVCKRCVRFLKEVTNTQELGIFERGIHTSVNIYEQIPVDNNYSGNLAQICPVGAITDIDFRFKTRSWFLKKGDSICSLCSRGCNISIEYHPGAPHFQVPRKIFRISSRKNLDVNGFWICDMGRYGYSYINENRLDRILRNKAEQNAAPTWEQSLQFIAEKIKGLISLNKTSQIALVLNTGLSNEELFLIHKVFKSDLNVENIFLADPPPGEGDDFLLTPERSPNRRGAQEMGLNLQPLKLEALAEKTRLLLVFGSFIQDHFNPPDITKALDKTEVKILLASHSNDLNSSFDIVLPTAVIAEKGGSLTNVDGRIQRFNPVFDPPGESLPEWRILADFGRAFGTNASFYESFKTPEAISKETEKEIPFFRETK